VTSWLNISLFASICPVFLAIYAVERAPRSPRNLYFAGLCLAGASLGLGSLLAHGAPTAEAALTAARATRWCFVFTPAFFLAFTLHFCHVGLRIRRPLIATSFAVSAVFSALSFSPLMVGEFVRSDGFYKPVYGPIYGAYMVFAVLLLLLGAFVYGWKYRVSDPYQRNRMKLMMVALVLAVAGGLAGVFLMHEVTFPVAPWAVFLACPLVAMAFLRHRLLDVGNYVRLTITFVLLLGALLVPVYAVLAVFLDSQTQALSLGALAALGVGQVLLTVLVLSASGSIRWHRVARLLQSRERMDYSALLGSAHSLLGLPTTADVADELVSLLGETTTASTVLFYIGDEEHQGFVLMGREPDAPGPGRRFDMDHPVFDWLVTQPGTVLLQDLGERPHGSIEREASAFLSQHGIDASVPVRTPARRALILLGSPKEGSIYEPTDVHILDLLAGTVSSALESAHAIEQRQVDREIERLSRTVAGLAHEFRNSMLPARTFLELIPERSQDEGFVCEFSGVALGQLRRSFRIIEQLKQLHVDHKPALAEHGLGDIVEAAVSSVQPMAEQQGVSVRLSLHPRTPTVRCDQDQITQATMNLLLNALQHAQGEPVLVRVYPGAVTDDGGETRAVITVHNRGEVSAERAADVFVPFYTTRSPGEDGGTGLGLPIAQKIVHDHGGQLTFQSSPAEGTTFVLVLPEREGLTSASPSDRTARSLESDLEAAALELAAGVK
jgi:signal transduction histidine kinase